MQCPRWVGGFGWDIKLEVTKLLIDPEFEVSIGEDGDDEVK